LRSDLATIAGGRDTGRRGGYLTRGQLLSLDALLRLFVEAVVERVEALLQARFKTPFVSFSTSTDWPAPDFRRANVDSRSSGFAAAKGTSWARLEMSSGGAVFSTALVSRWKTSASPDAINPRRGGRIPFPGPATLIRSVLFGRNPSIVKLYLGC
jgi:hypothetical protein